MENRRLFTGAVAVAVGLMVASLAFSLVRDDDAHSVGELIQLEELPPRDDTVLNDHLAYSFEVLGGTLPWTEADMQQRFTAEFREAFPPEDLNQGFTELFADVGTVRFMRIPSWGPDFVEASAVGASGDPLQLNIGINDDGQVGFWQLEPDPKPPRVRPWETTLVLLAAATLTAGSVVAWRLEARRQAWLLLAAVPFAVSTVLVLADASVLYTLGRTAWAVAVVPALAALLFTWTRSNQARLSVGLAIAAAVAGIVAPLLRAPARVGHPDLILRLADSDLTYRIGLAAASVLLAAAMAVATIALAPVARTTPSRLRPAAWLALAVAAAWAVFGLAAVVDVLVDEGIYASGAIRAATLGLLALTPVVVVFGRVEQVRAELDEVAASRSRILEAGDTARRRIERDLHDGAQQRLVALGLRLQLLRRQAQGRGDDAVAQELDEATSDVREIIAEIRAVSRGAQPALLAERGLAPAVDALAEKAPVPVDIVVDADGLSQDAERTAYFVVAEGLTNIAKHAAAGSAEVSIVRNNGVARVRISDDGHGGADMSAGSGLEGLNDRVSAVGGDFSISSGPAGTVLEAAIPCE